MNYGIRRGSPIAEKDHKRILGFLTKKFKDEFTSDDLLSVARPKSSPLHKYFDWNDSTAGEKYRSMQANSLVNSFYIVEEKSNKKVKKVFTNIRLVDKSGKATRAYARTEAVERVPDLKEQLVEKGTLALFSWLDTYGSYDEFKGVVRAISKHQRPER